jgi:hypothetical protein
MDNDKVKNEFWDMIKRNIPVSIILTVGVYAIILVGGFIAYDKLISKSDLPEDYISSVSTVFLWIFIIVTCIVAVLCLLFIILPRKKKKQVSDNNQQNDYSANELEDSPNSKTEVSSIANTSIGTPYGKITAFVFEQSDDKRDEKFNTIYRSVNNTYWVLGVSLTSVVDRETTIKAMAERNIKIRICMTNPNIAVDNLCLQNFENDKCVLANLYERIKNGSIEEKDLNDLLFRCESCDSILKLYNVLIDGLHFKEYYGTSTDYKGLIAASYNNIINIRNDIIKNCGQDSFELKTSNSFIPMSLTIADADEDYGRMIVEFHLPFTNYKVLFEIAKTDNKDLFDVFVTFYNKIWGKGK